MGELYDRRLALRISKAEAARRIGVHRNVYARWESGETSPDETNALKVREFVEGRIGAAAASFLSASGPASKPWRPTPAQRKALLVELDEDYPGNVGIDYGHAADGRFTATVAVAGRPSVRLYYGPDGGIERREALATGAVENTSAALESKTKIKESDVRSLTGNAVSETIGAMLDLEIQRDARSKEPLGDDAKRVEIKMRPDEFQALVDGAHAHRTSVPELVRAFARRLERERQKAATQTA